MRWRVCCRGFLLLAAVLGAAPVGRAQRASQPSPRKEKRGHH